MMQNKDMVPAIKAGLQPVVGTRCVAWDDDMNYFVSGIYLGYENSKHLVKTDYDENPAFGFAHAVSSAPTDDRDEEILRLRHALCMLRWRYANQKMQELEWSRHFGWHDEWEIWHRTAAMARTMAGRYSCKEADK